MVGYTSEDLKGRTVRRRRVEEIQLQMLEVAGDDPLKQIQFADAVWKRFIGLKHKIVKDDEQPGSNYYDETEDCAHRNLYR